MTEALSSLLRLNADMPKCEAGSCRKRAVVRLRLTHPRWEVPQSTALCGGHEPVFVKAAQHKGVIVTVEKRSK